MKPVFNPAVLREVLVIITEWQREHYRTVRERDDALRRYLTSVEVYALRAVVSRATPFEDLERSVRWLITTHRAEVRRELGARHRPAHPEDATHE